ncbi:hypothetical protein NKV53_00285 [Legionella sp. 27cVA30]|uniref:ATP-grasp domain-containing protein n=1 Tax=Legionella septentrionalis TaxID=2498109 RepID=A0A3S0X5B2_9GAMM|nr:MULTISPECIES: hypothetical protein [Legionella]MCP0912822.1 hypothetical protein [Legionella sp. 27cVA30]RUQ89994.1 hypothetical protein EKM59_02280 [Legionella septentrionalis]RUR16290.1 hypothetical protein ELY10_03590 [Legionella septentrionalis]
MNKVNCYYQSALKLHLPAQLLPEIQACRISLGNRHFYFYQGLTPFNSFVSTDVSRNNYCVNKLLENADIPVPKAIDVHVNEFNDGLFNNKLAHCPYPLLLKPLHKTKENYECFLADGPSELKAQLAKFFKFSEFVIVEESYNHLPWYRVLVCYGKILGVVKQNRQGSFTAIDKSMCKENKRLFKLAAAVLNLNLVEFSVACPDLHTPLTLTQGAIVDVYNDPDVHAYEHPSTGISIPVTQSILRRLIFRHPLPYLQCIIRSLRNR